MNLFKEQLIETSHHKSSGEILYSPLNEKDFQLSSPESKQSSHMLYSKDEEELLNLHDKKHKQNPQKKSQRPYLTSYYVPCYEYLELFPDAIEQIIKKYLIFVKYLEKKNLIIENAPED